MKNFKTVVSVFLVAILFSCGDDPKPLKKFKLEDFLAKTGFGEEVINAIDDGPKEFGLRFIPRVNGVMSNIIVKLPANRTDLRVTLWDAVTMDDLRTEIIASVTADVETSQAIATPIVLEKGHEYMITFNSDDWYEWSRTDGGEAEYPLTVGTLIITGFGYTSGIAQAYPTSFPTNSYSGNLSFVFQEL